MGFKTKNLYVEEQRYTLPEAYAIITHLEVNDNICRADFSIQTTRELAQSSALPFHRESVEFEIDRNATQNLYEMAYKKAKEPKVFHVPDPQTCSIEDITVPSYFTNWEDDIVNQ